MQLVLFLAAMPAMITGIDNFDALKERVMSIPLVERVAKSVFTDWARGAITLVCCPLILFVLLPLIGNESCRDARRLHLNRRAKDQGRGGRGSPTYEDRINEIDKEYQKDCCFGACKCSCISCGDRCVHMSEHTHR